MPSTKTAKKKTPKDRKNVTKPTKIIDWEQVDQLLIAGCTGTEVAAHLGIHPDTLYLRCKCEKKTGFSDYSQQKKAKGDTLLRAAQFDEAVRGRDRGMLIWLGKNRLRQSDKETVEHKGNIPFNVVNFGEKKTIEQWGNDESSTSSERRDKQPEKLCGDGTK